MSGPLLRHQADVSAVVPMPVDRVDDASTVTAVSGETLTWFYVTSSAWASATGQAAGTIVTGKLAFTGVLNSMKSAVGSYNDTSLSFAAATRAETKVSIPENVVSQLAFMSPTDQAATVAVYLTTAGHYFIDHRRGQIWLKSKDTVANDSVSYSYMAPVAGSGGPTANVNLNQVGGTAITLGQKTMAASIPVVLPSDAAANSGSASSGDATYMSPSDFTAVYASGTTLTLTGLPFAPTTGQFMSVKRQDTTGMSVTYTPDVKAFSYNSTTGVLTVTGAAFTATDVFVVTVIGPTKSLDTSTDAKRVSQIRDLSDQYVAEDLIDTTNVAAATNYYPSSSGVSMDGYRNLSIEALTSGGVTSTIEVTIDGASSPDWIDITSQVYDWVTGAYAASYVDVNFLMFLENLNVKALRIKSVTSDATNAVQYNIRRLF